MSQIITTPPPSLVTFSFFVGVPVCFMGRPWFSFQSKKTQQHISRCLVICLANPLTCCIKVKSCFVLTFTTRRSFSVIRFAEVRWSPPFSKPENLKENFTKKELPLSLKMLTKLPDKKKNFQQRANISVNPFAMWQQLNLNNTCSTVRLLSLLWLGPLSLVHSNPCMCKWILLEQNNSF